MSITEVFGLRHFLRVPSWPLWLRVAQIEALPIFCTLVVDQLSVCRQFATWPVGDVKSVFVGRRSEQTRFVARMSKSRRNTASLPLDHAFFAVKQRKPLPHEFVLDAL